MPIDASEMFSEKLSIYIVGILKAARDAQSNEMTFEEAYKDVPMEIKRGITTTSNGECG